MYIRCAECHGTVWMHDASRREAQAERACRQCGARYQFDIAKRFDKARHELAQAACRLGQERGLDLPGAYSVLLGVMTIEQVMDLGRGAPFSAVKPQAPVATTSAAPRVPATAETVYDPAFRPAVEAGTLTARQANERGERKAVIGRLRQRHKLPEDLAEAVTDNRLSLLAAVRQREKDQRRREHHTMRWETATSPRPLVAVAITMVAVLLVGVYAVRLWVGQIDEAHRVELAAVVSASTAQETGPAAAESVAAEPLHDLPPAGTRVITDQASAPVSIQGPTPKAVLLAYCVSGVEADSLEPVELASPQPTERGLRFGIVRDFKDAGRIHAIQIRQDHGTRRWFAGDGITPIPRLDPDRLQLAEARMAVYSGAISR